MLRKKKRNNYEKKFIAIGLAVFIALVSINPSSVIFAYDESVSAIIDAKFNEILAEDDMSATVTLQIDEKDNQEIVAITMPDGSKVEKEKFEYDENKNIIVKYLASDNGELSYSISYKEKATEVTVDESGEANRSTEEAVADTTSEVKEEKITYNITDIKTVNDMKLDIVASELSSPVGAELDVMKDIVIKDEDGNDVTSMVNIEVSDYAGFSKDKVGTYTLTYRTLHPVSEETYTFVRKITIIDTKTNTSTKQKSRIATLSNDASIQLSSGNASLKDPSDFRIGRSDQEIFNVTVNYASDAVAKDRELQVYIPKGFILEKEITIDQISSAESITTAKTDVGETRIRIVFKKNIEITSSFDLLIRQDKKYLYDQANLAKQSYAFRAESYENTSKIKEGQLAISPDKLRNTVTDKLITIDPVDKYKFDYSKSNGQGNVQIGNEDADTFVIKKAAYSDLNTKKLRLPYRLENDLIISWGSSYEVLVNGKVIKTGNSLLNGYSVNDLLIEIPEFMYSYEDTELRIHGVGIPWFYSSQVGLYDNPKNPFQSLDEISMDGYQSFGKISIAAKNSKSPAVESRESFNSFVYDSKPIIIKQGCSFSENDIINSRGFIYSDADVHSGNTNFEFDFPFEIQPTSIRLDGAEQNLFVVGRSHLILLTNTGKTIKLDRKSIEVLGGGKINFSTKLNPDEYVTNAKYVTSFTGEVEFAWGYNALSVDKDGGELGDEETVEVKTKIYNDDMVLYTKDYPVILYKANKDNMYLENSSLSDTDRVIGRDERLGWYYIGFPYNSKDYDDYEITFEGKEVLSLIRSMQVSKGSTVIFSSNKRNNVILHGVEATLDFGLDADEYITSLKIEDGKYTNAKKHNDSSHSTSYNFRTGNLTIPETLPYNGERIADKSFVLKTTLEVDGRRSEATSRTYTFREEKLPKIDFSEGWATGGHNSLSLSLFSTKIESVATSGKLDNLLLDYSKTDKKLLSLVGSITTNAAFAIPSKVKYVTNKGEEKSIDIKIGDNGTYDLNLAKDEFVTKLWIEVEKYDIGGRELNYSINFLMRSDYPRTYPYDGSFIGGASSTNYDALNSTMEWSADNAKGDSKTVRKKMTGVQEFEVSTPNADKKVNILPSTTSAYQNEKFSVTINNLPFTIKEVSLNSIGKSSYHRGDENYIRMVNPTVYIVVNKSYSINPKDINLQGYDADIKFEDGILKNKDSLLTITFKNYEKLFRSGDNSGEVLSLMQNLVLPVFVKPNSIEGNKTVIKNIYYDLDQSMQTYKSYIADLKIDESIKIIPDDGVLNGTKALYPTIIDSHIHKVLPVTEMGTSSTGQVGNSTIGLDVTGHDNDTYKQELSIISNVNQATYDWKLYIPVPKKGKTVKYVDGDNILESAPADFSFYLSKGVELADKPAGTKIEYTTDANPKYSLTGNDGGNYTESPTNLKDVTMIRITIPKIDAKQKLFPAITYKVDGSKEIVGKQTVFGANYYNAKVGSNTADYTFGGGAGGYAPLVNFNLADFKVNGAIWEDTEEPQNNHLDNTDIRKQDVEVVAKSKNGKEYKATTDVNGEYSVDVPSSGDTTLKVTLPNTKDQVYNFVDPSNDENGSKVNTLGEVDVVLKDTDIFGINAGLWANRSISVNPNSITVRKGFTENIPVTVFPTYSKITFIQSKDENIASVSDTGVVTGKKVGKTKATVSIPDGKGGVKTAEYEINVIPANAPSATSKPLYIFQGGHYNEYSGITILDGEGNAIDVAGAMVSIDTSKVKKNVVGRYPITYTINDGYLETVHTRYIYVYGTPEVITPENKVLKIDTAYNALEGVKGTYTHVDEYGNIIPNTPVTLTTSNPSKTPLTPSTVNVHITVNVPIPDGSPIFGAPAAYSIDVHGYAYIQTAKDSVTVKVGESLDEIKKSVDAKGFLPVDGAEQPLSVDWSAFKGFDTTKPGNTLTANITVTDPDTNEIVSKPITITISKGVIIDAPKEVDIVEGNPFDPKANITIKDGDGNIVTVTEDMIDAKDVDVTIPGNYEVEYKYKDGYGNENTARTTVKVHGKLQFNDTDIHQIKGDETDKLNATEELSKLAWFIDSNGDKKSAVFVSASSVNSNTVEKAVQTIVFKHPHDVEKTINRNIYTHGKVEITKPANMSVKVNTEVEILKNVSASYQHVNADGTISDVNVDVTSALGTHVTSANVAMIDVPLNASKEVISGLENSATTSYKIAFNGVPSITTKFNELTVRVGATIDEIKTSLNASSSVHYAKDATPTDLTDLIIWEDLDKVDTSNKKGSYVITLKVTDADGEEVSKKITIKISDEIIINLPNVDKVIGDSFDPFEGVEIFDGNGNKVNSDDVIVDDSKVDMSQPGSYDVEYTYKDEYGNEKKVTNTVKVNGKLVFEKLDRIDLIEEDGAIYVPTQGKAYYIDYNKKRVDVDGTYDQFIDKGVVNKNTVHFSATHPVDGSSESHRQNIYVHGDIVFKELDNGKASKVNDVVNLSDKVSASYKHVNDDGSIEEINVKVTDKNITSDKVGYIDAKVNAEIEIVDGLVNKKSADIKVAFNGLGFIDANSSVSFTGVTTKKQIIDAINATAGMKNADGYVVDLTSSIDYSDLNSIKLDKSGEYTVRITVVDPDGFKTYKDVMVTIAIPKPEEPNKPGNPENPENPNKPGNPENPENPNNPGNPVNPIDPTVPGDNENSNGNNDQNKEEGNKDTDKKEDSITVIIKDIPLDKLKDGIDDDLIKSYITATSKSKGIMDFTIVSSNIKNKVGSYKVTIRLADGSEKTYTIKVIDDSKRDVQQPEFGRDDECFIHWVMLLLLLGYSGYSITLIMKKRNDNINIENAMEEYAKQKNEGGNENEN